MEKNNEEKNQGPAPEASVTKKVTSNKDVDFPSLGWAIKAGEVRDLPADAEAQATILSSSYITLIKN